MSRGRLVWPMGCRLAQLDAEATAADPDDGGPLTSGYDADFREPVVVPTGVGGPGTPNRRESLTGVLPCQVEVAKWDTQLQAFGGNLPQGSLILTFHFADLERLGMLDDDGAATIRVGDRLEGIYRLDDGRLVQRPRDPLYAVEPEPNSFGLSALRRNLLLVGFSSRDGGALVPP